MVTPTFSDEPTYFFQCTACGKCCNSPPAMTLPELFHHEERFIGVLALRRIPRVRPGTAITHGTRQRPADSLDALEAERIAELVLHRLPDHIDSVMLGGQAFGYASENRCPALDLEGRCGVHRDRKPLTCSVVPLDALLPDRLQSAVLSSRTRELVRLGSDCIRTREEPEFSPLARGDTLLDASARVALAAQREALVLEKRTWGARVFQTLARDGSFEWRALPASGHFELSLAPALLVLADVSPTVRQRCIGYLDAQARLGQMTLESAFVRRNLIDRPATHRLRAFMKTNAVLRQALEETSPRAWSHSALAALDVERWLDLAPAAASTSLEAQP